MYNTWYNIGVLTLRISTGANVKLFGQIIICFTMFFVCPNLLIERLNFKMIIITNYLRESLLQ